MPHTRPELERGGRRFPRPAILGRTVPSLLRLRFGKRVQGMIRMKNAALRCVIVLSLLMNALAISSANPVDRPPVDGAGYVDASKPDASEYVCPHPDALNVIDLTCSANDACGGAEAWALRATGSSSGHVGGTGDASDWSKVEVYWNEALVVDGTLAADSEHGLAIETGYECSTALISSLIADHNGWYDVKVGADVHATYALNYHIVANDALSGKDVGSTPADAHPISALPNSLDPTRSITYKGSIPNRETPLGVPERDHDLYRIGTNLAALSDPTRTEGPAIGLLTVTAHIACNGGAYEFGLYGPDGLTPVRVWPTCGPVDASCVTSGVLPMHAKFGTTGLRGTGYRFNADLLPLYLVDLNDGVPRPHLTPAAPFCDVATSAALEAGGWASGADIGLVNPDGLVVAKARTNQGVAP